MNFDVFYMQKDGRRQNAIGKSATVIHTFVSVNRKYQIRYKYNNTYPWSLATQVNPVMSKMFILKKKYL